MIRKTNIFLIIIAALLLITIINNPAFPGEYKKDKQKGNINVKPFNTGDGEKYEIVISKFKPLVSAYKHNKSCLYLYRSQVSACSSYPRPEHVYAFLGEDIFYYGTVDSKGIRLKESFFLSNVNRYDRKSRYVTPKRNIVYIKSSRDKNYSWDIDIYYRDLVSGNFEKLIRLSLLKQFMTKMIPERIRRHFSNEYSLCFSQKGNEILFTIQQEYQDSDNFCLYKLTDNYRIKKRVIKPYGGNHRCWPPLLSPNGKKVATHFPYSLKDQNIPPNDLVIIDTSNSEKYKIIKTCGKVIPFQIFERHGEPCLQFWSEIWSPDSKKVLFVRAKDSNKGVVRIISPDRKDLIQILEIDDIDKYCSQEKDKVKIVDIERDIKGIVGIADIETGKAKTILEVENVDKFWNPDLEWTEKGIVITTKHGIYLKLNDDKEVKKFISPGEVTIFDQNGPSSGGVTLFTQGRLSPDGKKIMFFGHKGNTRIDKKSLVYLYIVDLKTGKILEKPIDYNYLNELQAAWIYPDRNSFLRND